MILDFKNFKSLKENKTTIKYNNLIDFTILNDQASVDQIKEYCDIAKQYKFASVCVKPDNILYAKSFLEDSNVKVCTVISFPKGTDSTIEKIKECTKALSDGADEVDVVMNYTKLLKKEEDAVEDITTELRELTELTHSEGKIIKVIIESGILTFDQIRTVCECCVEAGVDFVKTSTGYAKVGAELDKVKFMRKILPDYIKIKASGGIRTIETIEEYAPYVDRIGMSANPFSQYHVT